MKLRVSSCGVLYQDAGQLVWDDYLEHRQVALAPDTEKVLRWFSDWQESEVILQSPEVAPDILRWSAIVQDCVKAGLLVDESSERNKRELAIMEVWQTWGPASRFMHFGTRTQRNAPYVNRDEDAKRLNRKIHIEPPPQVYRRRTTNVAIPLPPPDESLLQHRDLLDVLRRRRSVRKYDQSPLSLSALSTILHLSFASVKLDNLPLIAQSQATFKTSPSGGGRAPIEAYPLIINVEGIPSGFYHYLPAEHALERMSDVLDPKQLIYACGDQAWVGGATAAILYTAFVPRTLWKYSLSRAYRVLMMDLGHVNQTVFLLATACGLSMTFTAALRDEIFEECIDADPASEIMLGTAILGNPVDSPLVASFTSVSTTLSNPNFA